MLQPSAGYNNQYITKIQIMTVNIDIKSQVYGYYNYNNLIFKLKFKYKKYWLIRVDYTNG